MADTEISVLKNEYVAFDGLSLKKLIIDRLNRNANFTDQNFEGSNLSALIDVISYSYHTLMYYLNQTANEGMFSEAQILENINRIVKILDYKPVGAQTSTLSFSVSADTGISPGQSYTIPRYSFFRFNNFYWSFADDITFIKTNSSLEALTDFSSKNLLLQGRFQDYPSYTAIGDEYETVFMKLGDGIIPDHFNIHVYVKDYDTGKWTIWSECESLFLENPTAKKYEKRLNEKGYYEFKFGNDINGKKLKTGDTVQIFYLQSNGSAGEVGIGVLKGKNLFLYRGTVYDEIVKEILDGLNLVTNSILAELQFDNENISTRFSDVEDVASIRRNAPGTFKSQYRLVTGEDFENWIKTNFSNIIWDCKVLNNSEYLAQHLRYLYDIGLDSPELDSNIRTNQLLFADACSFNNVYLYLVPKIELTRESTKLSSLSEAQKNFILKKINPLKVLTCDVIPMDPVHMAFSLGVNSLNREPSLEDLNDTRLTITLKEGVSIDRNYLKRLIFNTIKNFFLSSVSSFGREMQISSLVSQILNLVGISSILTEKVDGSVQTNGLSFIVWNPSFPDDDISVKSQNFTLKSFQFPYYQGLENLLEKINVVTFSESSVIIDL